MKIDSSSISMNSSRQFQRTTFVSIRQTQSRTGSDNASLSLSAEGRLRMLDMRKNLRKLTEENEKSVKADQSAKPQDAFDLNSVDGKLAMLKKLLEALRATLPSLRGKITEGSELPSLTEAMTRGYKGSIVNLSSAFSLGDISNGAGAKSSLVRQTVATSYFSEAETTTFSTQGMVKTADGKEISFNLDLELSRQFIDFSQAISETTTEILCDPLVINVDNASAHVTDQKFFFDLDADGTEEEISFLENGSGFLALDRNDDGKINDGTELFGTQSGDGFSDLAEYDSDGNGWIDENDSVFNRLKIWTKDEKGNDMLIRLTDADVGAIYLGNVSTDFSLNNLDNNQKNAQIRKTGIYLKESGGAGTVQHVDLAL